MASLSLPSVAAALLCLSGLCAGCAPPESGVGAAEAQATEIWSPAPARDGNLRIATFNIRNYPELPVDPLAEVHTPSTHLLESDDDAIVSVLDRLGFDVLAVQEIVEPELFVALLERLSERSGRPYAAAFSDNAHSDNPQHVGVVVALDAARIAATSEHPEVDVRGTLRGGFEARIESVTEGGIDFSLMVLHLASGSSHKRAALRAEQAVQVSGLVAAAQDSYGDGDFIVLGDLNTARAPEELSALDEAFASAAELERQPLDQGCSSYWVKSSSNPLVRPSLLDHVYVSSLDELDRQVPLEAGAHCFEHSCQAYESTDASSGGSFWGVSDHCPVYFELSDVDQD